mmetsp:Transcript_38636/g.82433  ORF Transcript_38636/g.82433 Transcript_38636/m.82433 type:complete len:205 (+) Transcript_38636:229-843(+)
MVPSTARGRHTPWWRPQTPNLAGTPWIYTTQPTSSWAFTSSSRRDIELCGLLVSFPRPRWGVRKEVWEEEWEAQRHRFFAGDGPTLSSLPLGDRSSPSRRRQRLTASTSWCRRICTPRPSQWPSPIRNFTVRRTSPPSIGGMPSTCTERGTSPRRWTSTSSLSGAWKAHTSSSGTWMRPRYRWRLSTWRPFARLDSRRASMTSS